MTDPSETVMSVWTLYDHPRDDPTCYVLRRFDIVRGSAESTDIVFRSTDIGWLRAVAIDMGLFRIDRSPGDEPQIVESWI